MSSPETDFSNDSNGLILSELMAPAPIFSIPFPGRNPTRLETLKTTEYGGVTSGLNHSTRGGWGFGLDLGLHYLKLRW